MICALRALDELGLVSALREQFVQISRGSSVQVVFEAPASLPSLPAAVEVATYRIVLEAVTNVVRHAQAQTCQVRLEESDELIIEVIDDGVGLPIQYHAGVGISSDAGTDRRARRDLSDRISCRRGNTHSGAAPIAKGVTYGSHSCVDCR